MKIAIRAGHNTKATGSAGLINEVTENRKLLPLIINYLRQLGHEVLDVTPGALDRNSDLAYGVNKANEWGADIFFSLHFNNAYKTYNGSLGTEVWVYSNSSKSYPTAKRVVAKLSGLGFKNRGIKTSTELYELRNTKMPSFIVEVCFVEATGDVELYKKLGVNVISKAIAEGVANQEVPKESATTTGDCYYRVVCGSFKNKEIAQKRADEVQAKTGHECFLVAYVP